MPDNQNNNSLFGIEVNPNLGTPLYHAYANNGPTWNIILPATLLFIVAFFGIILNSSVILVTIITPTLRGSANYLMALICFCEVLHASGHSIFFVIAVTGKNFVPLLAANYLMIPSLFALCTCTALMLSAAADRLFAVAIPHLHKSICMGHKRTYLSAYTIFCSLCGIYGLYFITAFSIQNPNIPITGCVAEILSGEVGTVYYIYSAIFNSLTALCYFLIWVIIRCKKGVTQETNTRLLRSLVCIMVVSVGGYIINLSVYQIFFKLIEEKIFSQIVLWDLGFIPGILLNVGAGSNAVILFFTSSEYRKTFKHHLNNLAKVCGIKGKNTVTAVAPLFHTSTHKNSKNGNNY
uniref:G_PROTEIN_RECEP_F1_2 domain-containing protein n=1 Tax=Meloidogyne hapla TaxID=6305 RepID=A0A1I8BZK5_MELHA